MDEIDRNQPLFDQSLPVDVRYPEGSRDVDLIIRVLNGCRDASGGKLRQSQKERLLRVEITDTRDPFFLYSLEVGEEDYHELKRDQRLLVDFTTFPRNLIEMLENCGASPLGLVDPEGTAEFDYSPHTELSPVKLASSYSTGNGQMAPTGTSNFSVNSSGSAVLNSGQFTARLEIPGCSGGEAMFSIVESNPFRELIHLGLRVRPASDSQLRNFLGQRLGQMKRKGTMLAQRSIRLETELGDERATVRALTRELESLQSSRQQEIRELKSSHMLEVSKLREEGTDRVERMAAEHNKKMEEALLRAEATVKELRDKMELYERKSEELTSLKFSCEAKIKEDAIKIDGLERNLETHIRELNECRAENASLDHQKHELEKGMHALQVKVAALEQQTGDKADALQRASQLHQAATDQQKQVLESLELYKQKVSSLQEKLELSVNEINRGNQIISKLQAEYQTTKSKLKLKSDVIRQQERLVEDQKNSYQDLRSKHSGLERELMTEKERADRLRQDLKESTTKLEESYKLIESNQQVITWLNKEINEAHLGKTGFNISTSAVAPPFSSLMLAKTPINTFSDENVQNRANTPLLYGMAGQNFVPNISGTAQLPLGITEGDSFLKQAMQKYGISGTFGTTQTGMPR